MKGLPALVLTYVLNILAVASTDYPPGIYCNIVTKTWQDAVENCKDNGGTLVSYVTGIGKTLDELHLKEDIDVWTADYAWELKNGHSASSTKWCGFDYLNSTSLDLPEVLYGCCDKIRNYLCKNTTTIKLDVHNGTRESIKCNETVSKKDLNNSRDNITPGYYWTSHILNLETMEGTSIITNFPRNRPVLCGAFKKTVGKYFVDCDHHRSSLCMISDLKELNEPINKLCFSARQSTTINALYSVSNTTAKTIDSVSESIERTSRTSRNQPVTVSVSDRNETGVSIIADGSEQWAEHENDSNIGVEVGVPVAILLALICGSLISIYLFRRYKCWQSRKSTKDNVRANTPSSMTSTMHENGQSNAAHKLIKGIPIKISNHDGKAYLPKTEENVYTDSNSEYATVNKNMKRPHAHTRPGKSTRLEYNSGQSNDTKNDEMNSYSYAVPNGDKFANAKEIQTSEYSFATELDGEVVNAKVHCNVTEGDYDVSGKAGTCSVNKSNNIYNTLQSGEYDSSAHVLKRNDCNRIYGVPQNAGSESVYDSVEQGNGSKQPDNIYNQLTNKASGSDKENK